MIVLTKLINALIYTLGAASIILFTVYWLAEMAITAIGRRITK